MAVYTAIDDPSAYFESVLYTGDGVAIGSGGNTITGVGFQPDFTWIKRRTGSTDHHCLFDSARGATKIIHTSADSAEDTNTETLTSWNSDGFVLGNVGEVNGDGQLQVAWNWLAGTTSGINTTGSTITPAGYSFNTTSGVSIVVYPGNATSGALVPHGLATVPHVVMSRGLNTTSTFAVYHHKNTAAPETDYLNLGANSATADQVNRWNDTVPTSVNFSLGDGDNTNGSYNYIAYVFAEKQGYSKFGSYTGNANADGPFVYLGFRPAWLMIKVADSGSTDWDIYDSKRPGYNEDNYYLPANRNIVENTATDIDLLSNGFKPRGTGGDFNKSGSEIIYMAFAEAPFVNSNGVPCNAR